MGGGNQERQGDWTKYGRAEGEETTGQRKKRQIGKDRDIKTEKTERDRDRRGGQRKGDPKPDPSGTREVNGLGVRAFGGRRGTE